jgi:hypothetical protein
MDTLPGEDLSPTLEILKDCSYIKIFNEQFNYILFEVKKDWIVGDIRYLFFCHRYSGIVRVRKEKYYYSQPKNNNCLMTTDATLEELFEDSKPELQDWITWNLDLFNGKEDLGKYHMELL